MRSKDAKRRRDSVRRQCEKRGADATALRGMTRRRGRKVCRNGMKRGGEEADVGETAHRDAVV